MTAIAEVDTRIQVGPERYYLRRAGELLHAAREPMAVLLALREQMGSFRFSAQYQQCPIPEQGEIIKWEWFELYEEPPKREPGDKIIQSWDTALKTGKSNDYSACLTFLVKGKNYYLLDVLRERLIYPDLKRRIIQLALEFSATSYIIEDKGSGTSIIQDIRSDGYGPIAKPIAFTPEGEKLERMQLASAIIEARHVYLPRDAPWLGEFHDETRSFRMAATTTRWTASRSS